MKLLDPLTQALAELDAQGLKRVRQVVHMPCAPHQSVGGQVRLNFSSNDYLGLANHPQVLVALKEGVSLYGAGSGASHLISGHSLAHEQLEDKLAQLYAPHIPQARALSLCTGYMANLAVLSALTAGAQDAEIFSDALNHASIIDGARLSRAKVTVYPHLDVNTLRAQLRASQASTKLVVTDSVFSMDGHIAPLPELLRLCEAEGAWLVVDDAHGFGVLGCNGLGALEHFDLYSPNLVLMGTLGKSAGVAGAFVAAHATVIECLVQRARAYIYTTAAPPALAHALLTSLDIITGPQGVALRAHLSNVLATWRAGVVDMFPSTAQDVPGAWLMTSATPIQPLVVGDNRAVMRASQALLDQGVWVTGIRTPTVPPNTARLRITFSAAHTQADVAHLLQGLSTLSLTPDTSLTPEAA